MNDLGTEHKLRKMSPPRNRQGKNGSLGAPKLSGAVAASVDNLNGMIIDSGKNVFHQVPTVRKNVDRENDEHSTTSALRVKNKLREKKTEMMNQSPRDWLETLLPAYRWLRTYEVKKTLANDVIAGLTVGIMVIPQSMSYAKLAGLPVQYGLYSAVVPVFAYALFGSSRQLAVGPVALLSLMLSTEVTKIVLPDGKFALTLLFHLFD